MSQWRFIRIFNKIRIYVGIFICLLTCILLTCFLPNAPEQIPINSNCTASPKNLLGSIEVFQYPIPTLQKLEKRFYWVENGGHYKPECETTNKVAFLVPYRNRTSHVKLFMQHMHPLLYRQQIEYTIFVIEQHGVGLFNRGILLNAGYLEAKKLRDFNCIILHDVDHLPEDDRNMYVCPQKPTHMVQGIRFYRKTTARYSNFGGVVAMSNYHFESVNGFSNKFWGWGGEDDDLYRRILFHGYSVAYPPYVLSWYTMLIHKKAQKNPYRYGILTKGEQFYNTSGLNSVEYQVVNISRNKLFTHILLNIFISKDFLPLPEDM